MGRKIGVSIARGTLDVPNFVKDVLKFLKDERKIPKSVLGWRTSFNHYLRPLNEQMDHRKKDRGLDSLAI